MSSDYSNVSIEPYDVRYKSDFKRLNETWISEHFELEETDRRVLDEPEESIIDLGGEILFAIVEETVVGTCALIHAQVGYGIFELAKMAVDPLFRRRGIGKQLGMAVVDRARELGARRIYLESNTVLGPAISLYRQLGFVETASQPTPYARGNIHMVLEPLNKRDESTTESTSFDDLSY